MIKSFEGITIDNINYRVLQNEDIEDAIQLTSKAFSSKEVILRAIGCSYEEYYEFMQSIRDDMIGNKTTLVAIDVEKSLLVGVLWGFDRYKPSKSNPKLSPIMQKQVDWILEVRQNFENLVNDSQQEGDVLSIQKAAVHQNYLGKGIMKNLVKYQQIQAEYLGYKYLFVLVSSPYVQHILKQQDFPEVYSLELREEDIKSRYPDIKVDFEYTKSEFRDGKPMIKVFYKKIQQ